MKTLPTIWMNVSTSSSWNRPSVGIVRVERSLCEELAKLYGNRFKQCIWHDGVFVEFIPLPIINKVPSEPENLKKLKDNWVPLMYPLLPRRQALIYVVQGLLSLLPGGIRPYFNRLLHYVRPWLVRCLTSNFMHRLKINLNRLPLSQSISNLHSRPTSAGPFSPGDVLISVGLDWDNDFYKEFYFLRKDQNVRIVSCCYDLIPVIYPQYCVSEVSAKFTSYFCEIADGSDLILCISKQSEADLIEMLDLVGAAKPRTFVFPLGDNIPAIGSNELSLAVEELCKETYILFVSSIERRKNHEILYRAYHLLCQEGKRFELPKLIFVGMPGWGVGDLLNDIKLDPLTQGLIVQLNHVTDAELRALYDAAKFCVFPSLYEGWGLPVGEALSLGKAVLSSDRGSLPEVGRDLVRYVDPWNPRAWADEIYHMSTNQNWLLEWETKAKLQYKAKTWAQAAASVADAIKFIDI